jgi:hypothetical protein
MKYLSYQKREAAQASAVRAEQGGSGSHLGHPEVGGRSFSGEPLVLLKARFFL